MARITRVKRAQQRYAQVPVIDPETGRQKRTPVMRANGQQKMTKRGTPVFMDVTVADRSQPLPNRTCGKCHQEIKVGDPYKHISPRSGPYGGRTMYRCASCPDWHVWEYSSSLSARVAQISHDFWESFNDTTFESTDEVQELLNSAAEAIREIAEEKREGASNIEDGFGHSTYQSDELNDIADQLDSWADDVEGVSLTDYPEPEEADCDECEGSGEVINEVLAQGQTDHEEAVRKLKAAEHRLKLYQAVPEGQRLAGQIEAEQAIIKRLTEEIKAIETRLEDVEATVPCEECNGTGRVEPDEPTQEQLDEWRSEVESEVSVVDECPV